MGEPDFKNFPCQELVAHLCIRPWQIISSNDGARSSTIVLVPCLKPNHFVDLLMVLELGQFIGCSESLAMVYDYDMLCVLPNLVRHCRTLRALNR